MSSVQQTIAGLQKLHGKDLGGIGTERPRAATLSTGVFALDYALGGGIPLNAMTLIHGAESSGKTLLATCLMREWQLRYPKRPCVLIEPEGCYDTDWAAECGLDWKKIAIMQTEYVEQTIDVLLAFLDAEDTGLIVLDSIAAAASQAELEKTADQTIVAGNAKQINSLCRKAGSKFIRAKKEGRDVTMVWINQPRTAMISHGNPETLPGGAGQRFFAATRLRLYGKKLTIAEHGTAPCMLDVSGTIKKYKHPINTETFKYSMVLREHAGLKPGQCNDWSMYHQHASELGLMVKNAKKGWDLVDPGSGEIETFPKQTDLWAALREDTQRYDRHRAAIMAGAQA